MKTALFFGFLLLSLTVSAQGKVTANMTNFRSDKGVCRVCVFSSAENYKSNKALQCVSVPVKSKKAQAVFSSIPAGNYAVFVFHDVNGNNKMDTNFMGIPSEGYGASRNNLPFASAPSFNANRFLLEDKGTVLLQIRLRNL
jgi:uncharacterized protein (DUF2141 family)